MRINKLLIQFFLLICLLDFIASQYSNSNSNQKDPYQILGVPRNADEKAIKRAHKQLAMQYHPDKNNGDSRYNDQFAEINNAYETLSNPQKKQEYDYGGDYGGNNYGNQHNSRGRRSQDGYTYYTYTDGNGNTYYSYQQRGGGGGRSRGGRGDSFFDQFEDAFTGRRNSYSQDRIHPWTQVIQFLKSIFPTMLPVLIIVALQILSSLISGLTKR